jgi:hypothetical protein
MMRWGMPPPPKFGGPPESGTYVKFTQAGAELLVVGQFGM